ncbi:hypothetical protein HK105_206715 [Polyrhizophydium stewartii]|uniref:PLOD1-3-like GT domain-containing protein n=1 Tax=Polyrhizophydium stewartii TaxID=2732419 RepID=A0ABR4N2R4_9FUNG
MLEYTAITMATNLRVMTSTTFSSRIRAWARARLNALVSHYLGHLAIVTIYPTRKARDASVEQVVSHAMGWIGPRFLDKKAPFREIGDATGATFSAYMHTRFQIKDARFKDGVAPINWMSVWAALNSKVLDYFVPIHAFERTVAEKQRDRPKNDEASKKTYLNDDWVASRRLMILRAVLRDVEVLEDEIQNKFRSENPGTRQQPPQLKKWALAPVAGYVPGSFRFPDETLQFFANKYSSSRRNKVKLKFDDFFSPNLFVKHGETLKTTRRLVIKRFLVSDGISTSIMSENGPKKAAILERHDDPNNIFNAPGLQQLDRNIRFLCTIDFNRKNYLVLRIAPLNKSYKYTGAEPTSKRRRKLVRDGVIFLKISKKEYKRVRCISRYNRIREQLEDQERRQRKLHRQMDIFVDPPSIKGTSVQLVWHCIAFLAETNTTQADTTQPNTTQPNTTQPNAQETKATSSESAGKGCRFGMLMQFYARHVFRRLRMESFSAKQKWPIHVQDRIYDAIQRLRPDWNVRNPRKCRDQDNPRILFAVGDGNFKHNSAGHITMPTATPLFESFRALGEAVYWVDEYNTSKCCSRCGSEMEQGLKHKNAQPLASAAAAHKERKASKITKRRAKELLKYARNRIRQNEKRIEQLLQTRPILPQRPISWEVAKCDIQFALVNVARQYKEGSKDEFEAAPDFARRLQASLDAALQSAAQAAATAAAATAADDAAPAPMDVDASDDATAPPERLVHKRQSPRVGADRRLSCLPPQSLRQGTDPLVASNYNAKDLISPWGLRYCPGCNTLWCRDKNAVINMALRVLFYLNQPQQFDEEGKPMPKQDGPPHLRLALLFVCLIGVAVVLMGLTSDPEIPYKAAEVYMSCLAPRLSSFNSLMNIESQPCTAQARRASIDTRLLLERPDEFTRQLRRNETLAGVAASDDMRRCRGLWTSDGAAAAINASLVRDCVEWVTFSTKCSKNLNRLTALVERTGAKFTILGMHTMWTGFGGRIHTLAQYLKTVPDDRIVIFTDGDDVVPLPTCSAAHMAGVFRRQDTAVLFMAERECWPDEFLKEEYPAPSPRPSPFVYLNGGSYAGYAWALRDVIAQAYTINCSDDQRGFTRVYLSQTSYEMDADGRRRIYATANKGRDLYGDRQQIERKGDGAGRPYIKLDWYAAMFQSLVHSRMEEFDFSRYNDTGRVEQLLTKSEPCVFHQNGDKHAVEMVLPRMIELLRFDTLWTPPPKPGGAAGVGGAASVAAAATAASDPSAAA